MKIKNHKSNQKGITLIEILVVIFIIALLSSILVADFPKIRRQFALTRAVYKLNQDLRKAQDMGLSGEKIEGINVKSYGVYINFAVLGDKNYIIYADMDSDQRYVADTQVICGDESNPYYDPHKDCVIERVDLSKAEAGVFIKAIENTNSQWVDINFRPPNPTITITNMTLGFNRVQIIFALEFDELKTRIVLVNTSGLIEIK